VGIRARRNLRNESLRGQIEAFAPKRYVKERDVLFQKFHALRIERPMLVRILAAWRLTRPREYWNERKKVENHWKKIEHSPVVRRFPSLADITFFEPQEFYCPHEIKRKDCLQIGEAIERTNEIAESLQRNERKLQNWRDREQSAKDKGKADLAKRLRDGVTSVESQIRELGVLKEKQYRILAKKGIESVDGVQYCKSTLKMPLPPGVTPPGRGRPRERGQYLVGAVGDLLMDAGLSQRKAAETITDILVFCFDSSVSTDSLVRQWQKRRRNNSS